MLLHHRFLLTALLVVSGLLLLASEIAAHEQGGHRAATYEVTAPLEMTADQPFVRLHVIDATTGKPLTARFSLNIEDRAYTPPGLSAHGLRFVSIHQGKRQQFEVLYARGTGPVDIPVPDTAQHGRITVVKGFEFVPVELRFERTAQSVDVTAALQRWSSLESDGWLAADEHLHYERLAARHDADWLTMLSADGLADAHFLVLKGGNLPGVWAQQFAYGVDGTATDGWRLIHPGEEYRDGSQGHINLLRISEIIEPISTGGIGGRSMPFHYPPLIDVMRRTREQGGMAGPAHGAKLSRSPTAVLDTILGGVDFFEIANTHLYERDVWYQLMNCGYIVPPAAGTDLPNFPFRDPWQPFLGEVRTYVRAGNERSFAAWKAAFRRGEVFVSSGPLISMSVGGVEPGGVVQLPPQGGEVPVQLELASPRPLTSLELICNGDVVALPPPTHQQDNGIHRWRVVAKLPIASSCWLAARGTGELKVALSESAGVEQATMAHTAAMQVLVGEQPIATEEAVEVLRRRLATQREFYRNEARYERDEHRERFVALFEEGLKRLNALKTQ